MGERVEFLLLGRAGRTAQSLKIFGIRIVRNLLNFISLNLIYLKNRIFYIPTGKNMV